MRRIVIDARSVSAKKSGIGNYTAALVRHMVPMAGEFEFTLLRQPGSREPIVADGRVREIEFRGDTKSLDTVFRLGRAHHFGTHDLYHSPADLIPLGLACPWVVTVHDLMWVEAPHLASSFLPVRVANGLWYRWNIKRAVTGARRVIAISEATASAIDRVYPERAPNVRVVHHGIDTGRYAAAVDAPRSDLDAIVPREARYSLIVGQGSPYKNHDGMVRAFVEATRDERQHLLVLVRRFSRVDGAMQRLLRQPEVQRKVVVVPSVTDDTLLALYKHARMLLFASHYEGFGMPALEAMSMGLPVLASRAEAVQEITGDAALHADSWDHRDLVHKIRCLNRDEEIRSRLVEVGRRRAEQFRWSACAAATLDVYREALS